MLLTGISAGGENHADGDSFRHPVIIDSQCSDGLRESRDDGDGFLCDGAEYVGLWNGYCNRKRRARADSTFVRGDG